MSKFKRHLTSDIMSLYNKKRKEVLAFSAKNSAVFNPFPATESGEENEAREADMEPNQKDMDRNGTDMLLRYLAKTGPMRLEDLGVRWELSLFPMFIKALQAALDQGALWTSIQQKDNQQKFVNSLMELVKDRDGDPSLLRNRFFKVLKDNKNISEATVQLSRDSFGKFLK